MTHAHTLNCEKEAADCRFIIQSEDESETVELAKRHMKEVHGKEFTDEELKDEYMEIV